MGVADQHTQLAAVIRQHEIEQFYFHESGLLDDRRFDEWIDLFTDDAEYFMPIRRTMSGNDIGREFTKPGEIAFFDDDKKLLASRIKKLGTGRSWSEDPPSRTRHLITNVTVLSDDGTEMEVRSNFHVYRTRLHRELDNWVGHRVDRLRRGENGLMIANRVIYIDQTILDSANLSVFF